MRLIKPIFVLFLVLSFAVLPAMAGIVDEPKNSTTIIHKDAAVKDSDIKTSSEKEGGLSADKIFSDNYVLGFKRGEGKVTDIVNVKNSIGVISSSDIVWAIVNLFFAVVIGLIIFGFFGANGLNGLKMVKAALFSDDPEEAVDTINKASKSSKTLLTGLGTIALIVVSTVFILSLL